MSGFRISLKGKGGFDTFAKSIESYQPGQSAQVDMG